MVIFSSAFFVAMLLADAFKAAAVQPVFVVLGSIVLAMSVGGMVALQLLSEHPRPKR